MKDGVVQQVGTPTEVFNKPSNIFVAGFIGSPQMNFMDGKLIKKDNQYHVEIFDKLITLNEELNNTLLAKNVEETELTVGIRPDHFLLRGDGNLTAKVLVSEMMGTEYHLHVEIAGKKIAVKVPLIGLDGAQIANIVSGGDITFAADTNYVYLFDKETGKNIGVE